MKDGNVVQSGWHETKTDIDCTNQVFICIIHYYPFIDVCIQLSIGNVTIKPPGLDQLRPALTSPTQTTQKLVHHSSSSSSSMRPSLHDMHQSNQSNTSIGMIYDGDGNRKTETSRLTELEIKSKMLETKCKFVGQMIEAGVSVCDVKELLEYMNI